jgi:hypothetical protein
MKAALLVFSFVVAITQPGRGDEFQVMSDSFGTTRTLAGVKHATTTNPDGTSINFWTPASEGALASTVGLSNPHIAAADAYGNITSPTKPATRY